MKSGTTKALLMFVALAVSLAMVTATWSGFGPSGGHRPFYVVFPGSDQDRPDGLPPGGSGDGPATQALSPLPGKGGVVGIPSVPELKRLAELEGRQNFTNVLPSQYYVYGAEDAMGGLDTDGNPKSAPTREVEEADVVKVVGDLLYVLNPYRGLMIFDLGEPDVPRILGRAAVLGNPVDMYIVKDTAYIVMTANNGYWYRYAVRALTLDSITVPAGAPSPEYYIGTQVLVVDVGDPTAPSTVARFGIQGFATDSRRVGDVLYFVSTYHAWYYAEKAEQTTDRTFVMSLDLTDPADVNVVDEVSFAGGSNLINVTSSALFIAQPPTGWWDTSVSTTITYVDISDPAGDIEVRGSYTVSGVVQNRFQMDYFDGTLRVVSHHWNMGGLGSSDLWVLDVSDPDDLRMLGSLAIDDAGTLMATRFAGERAYTIHLPRTVDPLDVIDLSDPSQPVLTDILEMPGWVTHMEVRGMKIIALGVDDTKGQRVAVTLFDVSDPHEAVLLERVMVEGDSSWSGANFDPKALTVLDEVGLVLVPFSAYFADAEGGSKYMSGVQLVEFDLDAGTLGLAGFFNQPDEVLRTRAINDRLVATSTQFLQVVDATDRDLPFITASIELCPVVEDLRVVGSYAVAIVRGTSGTLSLRSYALSNLDVLAPVSSLALGSGVARWYWDGPVLHAIAWTSETDSAKFEVTTVDLSEPSHLRSLSKLVFGCENVPYYDGDSNWYYPYYLYGGGIAEDLYWRPYWYGVASGSALLEGGRLAIVHSSTLYVMDLSDGRSPTLASRLDIETSTLVDIEGHGDVLYLTDYIVPEVPKDGTGDTYTQPGGCAYRLRMYVLTNPAMPVEMAPVNIPGTPVGASPSLGLLYTTSDWYMTGDSGYAYTRTLNVLRLSGGVATMLASYDVGTFSTVEVEDGIAYLVRAESYVASRFWTGNYYQDVYEQTTNVTVLDLTAGERSVVLGVLTLSGGYYGFMVDGGYALLTSYDSFSVYAFHASRASGVERLGLYETYTTVMSIDEAGGLLYLAQGMYGTSVLDVR